MAERIQNLIADRAARIREIDARREQIASEIQEREAEATRLELERDREVYTIKILERGLEEKELEKSWTAQQRPKREGDPLSLPVLAQQILEKHPNGLKPPALYAEVRKLGFQTNSKNPISLLTATLHRRPDMFARRKVARGVVWFLKKYEHMVPAESTSPQAEGGSFSKILRDPTMLTTLHESGPPLPPTLRRVTK